MEKQREYWIDCMRVFACIMVLFCHAPAQGQSNSSLSIAFGVINSIFGMSWGPVLFFMISGACILKKDDNECVYNYLKRRFSRIAIPTAIWNAIYIVMENNIWNVKPGAVRKLLLIPFAPQYGLIWFMYALAAIYLIAPIISAWLVKCTRRDIEIYLLIWSICLLIPYMTFYVPEISEIVKNNGILHYFGGWLWVAVLGYYLRYYVKINKVKWYHFLFVFFCCSINYSFI